MKIYFGIDCAPGAIRPDVYASGVFKKLGVSPVEPYSKLFGAWEWQVTVDDEFNFKEFNSWMKQEMDTLYAKGSIRGAQWDTINDNPDKIKI